MKNLGYKSSKKSLQFKQLRNQFIELWYLRHELKQELLESKNDTGIDELFFQKCNEKFSLDLPVDVKNISPIRPTTEEPIRSPTQHSDISGELLSEVKPKFIEFWSKRDNQEKTVTIYKTTIQHFIDIVGDIPIDAITSKTVFEYKQKYLKIPNRRQQIPKYEGKSITEILEMNPPEKGRSVYSMNQSLRRLSTIAKWCCANTSMTQNPFASATEKGLKKTVKTREELEQEGLINQRKFGCSERTSW